MSTGRGIFLDRDGVLSGSLFRDGRPVAPTRSEEFVLLPGVPEALKTLKAAGYTLVVVTNQPDVATGSLHPAELDKMNSMMRAKLPLDAIKMCIHAEEAQCACRKPKPGMILDGARELSVDLRASYVIGDRWRNVDAGKAAGCRTILVGNGYREREIHPDWKVDSLAEAVRLILRLESQMDG
jgi:D-glycero-D-manno-heptose 1,7-bisphosphate phosphatase